MKCIEFLNNYYEKALSLSNNFKLTREKEWDSLIILNELAIQIGHIYNIIYKNEIVNEAGREFNNLGDELSDILLQLIALSNELQINMYDISKYHIKEDNWFSIPIIFGQLNESIMELYGYRFNKPRVGFKNVLEFIKSRILILFKITYQISLKYNLDIENEFEKMLEDANGFLKKLKKGVK